MVLGMLGNLLPRAASQPSGVEGGLGIPSGFQGSSGEKILRRADFYTSNVTFSANNASNYEELGNYTVLAQQAIRPGYGSAALPDNQGFFYFSLQTPAAAVHAGSVRINWKSANRDRIDLLKEYRSDALAGSTTLKTQRQALPELPIRGIAGRNWASEDERIALDWLGDTASLVASTTTTTILLSTTQFYR